MNKKIKTAVIIRQNPLSIKSSVLSVDVTNGISPHIDAIPVKII